jgi:hypothetical protein
MRSIRKPAIFPKTHHSTVSKCSSVKCIKEKGTHCARGTPFKK